jgi:hypothetical protein
MEIITESNCIIKAFNDCNIQIIKELPNKYLFCGNDLAKVLEITSIRSSVQNFTEKEKVVDVSCLYFFHSFYFFINFTSTYRTGITLNFFLDIYCKIRDRILVHIFL